MKFSRNFKGRINVTFCFCLCLCLCLLSTSCKDRQRAELKKSSQQNWADSNCSATCVSAVITATRGFKAQLSGDKVNFYSEKFRAINSIKYWQKYPLIEDRNLSDGRGSALLLHQYLVKANIGSQAPTQLTILLDQDDVLGSPIMTKHFLAQAMSHFFDQLEVQAYNSPSGMILGANLFMPSDSVQLTPAIPAGNPMPQSSYQDFLTPGRGDVFEDLLKVSRSSLALPLYTLDIVNLGQNRTVKNRQILPGDVFTVSYGSGLYGSGFGIWLGDKPVVFSADMEPVVLAFARLSADSLAQAQQLAAKLLSSHSTSLIQRLDVEEYRTTNLNAIRSDVKGEMEILGYRVSRSLVDGAVKISDPNQGQIPNFFVTATKVQDPILGGQDLSPKGQMVQLIDASHQLRIKYLDTTKLLTSKFSEISQKFSSMKHQDFEIFNQIERDLKDESSGINFVTTSLFDRANMFLVKKYLSGQGASQSPDLKAASDLVAQAESLAAITRELRIQTSSLLNRFNFVGERIKFDRSPDEPIIYKLQGMFDSNNGLIGMVHYTTINAAMFDMVSEAFVNNKDASIAGWTGGILWGYRRVNKNLVSWFNKEPFNSVLKELTNETPPELKWKDFALTDDYSNLEESSKVACGDFLKRNSHKIYFGLDSLRIEYGPNIFPIFGGGIEGLTSIGASRKRRIVKIQDDINKYSKLDAKRNVLMNEWITALKDFNKRFVAN